ncbi:MAG: hypothetical protein V3V12_05130 [Gammaproteobacteria bacterium]
MIAKIIIATLFTAYVTSVNANLIRNASFENVPDMSSGQGKMPSEWTATNSTPDTYSNDGSYGLSPSGFGNFNGVTAFDGIRWVAGWSLADERFGQLLSDPLIVGQSYTFSSYLIQAKRSDLDNMGGYELYLTADTMGDINAGTLLGSIGPTTDSDSWEFSSLVFTAPGNADTLPFLLFKPFGDVSGSAYPGLDNVNLSLTSVPIPASVWLFGSGILCLLQIKRPI